MTAVLLLRPTRDAIRGGTELDGGDLIMISMGRAFCASLRVHSYLDAENETDPV